MLFSLLPGEGGAAVNCVATDKYQPSIDGSFDDLIVELEYQQKNWVTQKPLDKMIWMQILLDKLARLVRIAELEFQSLTENDRKEGN